MPMRPFLSRKPDSRITLLDAAKGFVHPAFTYTRSGDFYLPQADGTVFFTAQNVLPRAYDAALGWHYRADPAWTQSCLRTNTPSHATWVKTNMNTPTQTVAGPNGTTDSWTFTETSANGGHYMEQSLSFTSGVTYTMCAIVGELSGTRFPQVRLPTAAFGANVIVSLNTSTGAIQTSGSPLLSGAVQLANGYWIVYVTKTATVTTSANIRVQLATAIGNFDETYTGDGTSGCKLTGVNVTNTAYLVPMTVSNTSTSNVGAPVWTATLANLSVVLGDSFALGCEYFVSPLGIAPGTRTAFQFDAGSNNNRIAFRYNAVNSPRVVSISASTTTTIGTFTVAEGTKVKAAMRAHATNNIAGSNGVMGSLTAAALPIGLTTARIGADFSSNQLTGGIIKIWASKQGLPDSLISLHSR